MKKTMKKPEVKVVKFKAVDICTASADTPAQGQVGLQGTTYHGIDWIK